MKKKSRKPFTEKGKNMLEFSESLIGSLTLKTVAKVRLIFFQRVKTEEVVAETIPKLKISKN